MADPESPSGSSRPAERLATLMTLTNVGLCLVLVGGYALSQSLLALAQAADSLMDVVLSGLLLWAARVAEQPGDAEHPHGHRAAEPIAALVTAVGAGVVAVELTASAVERLLGDTPVAATPLLLAAFGSKGMIKLVAVIVARRIARRSSSPVAEALWIDSRNDVLVAFIAVAGYFLTRRGGPQWDAWLTFPIAAWIAWAGVELARSNVMLLMGGAASDERQGELGRVVLGVPGVQSFHDLVARHHGTHLDVEVHVVLDPSLSLRRAHDIGDAVVKALEAEPDVIHAAVHLDVEDDAEDLPGASRSA